MKELQAFIRQEKLNAVYEALKKEGYCCMSVFEGEGTGKYTDPEKDWPSMKFPFMHSKVVKLEMICKDDCVQEVTQIIQKNGSTGRKGDGLIYITDVGEVIRVRDGASGISVLN